MSFEPSHLRICAIHDLSGFGRASLTVVIPILATMGFQVCPLPTAVLSSQTSGMEGFSFLDLTKTMEDFLAHWEKLGLKFSCIYSGFLGNPEQIEVANKSIENFLLPQGFAFVDPVLGDNGLLDPTQTPEMVDAQRSLVRHADIIAPNATEAAFLLEEPYNPNISLSALKEQLVALGELGPSNVIITSVPSRKSSHIATVAYEKKRHCFWLVENVHYPVFYPGTGDTFSSVVVGSLLQGDNLPVAIAKAVSFVSSCILVTYGYGVPPTEGFLLEKALPMLRHIPLPHYEKI